MRGVDSSPLNSPDTCLNPDELIPAKYVTHNAYGLYGRGVDSSPLNPPVTGLKPDELISAK